MYCNAQKRTEQRILLFRLKHTVAIVKHAHVLQNFYTTWVLSVACQKQHLGPKLEGAGLGEYPKIWTFCTKIGGGLDQGSIQKNWDPLLIFATIEASNFKFGNSAASLCERGKRY